MMNPHNQRFDWDLFWEFPAIGILRGFETDLVSEIGNECFEAGLKNIEVTLNTDNAFSQIKNLADLSNKRANVGAGTVLDRRGLDLALEAGASFIVSPVVDIELIHYCSENGVPIFPGAYTPTEVWKAWDTGAPVVKLFPANVGGPDYLKAIKGPLDDVKILAVGSVTLQKTSDCLASGACGVGLGSPLFDQSRMLAKDWSWLRKQIHEFSQINWNV
ncbi:MAG: bifunctional 4-hydroxy-2-oxoglutarate aldolase/2-dehydro-3-deoxy-phosphogluconate aldolase [Opitutales bacterium]|nr:bifunctional 4-hydroxy-2-oxoglutarate aldolase/2-dehydro-3-deoxy-phosphogluconate aldolase [Opitutales bacterium]